MVNYKHDRPNLYYISSLFTNKKLKKIVNVYQKQYINSRGQGFGDFLRGSIYLTYVCIILGLEFDIDLKNHSISKFFKISESVYSICYNDIKAYIDYNNGLEEENMNNFIQDLNKIDSEIYYLFNNYVPSFNIENPKFNIIQQARNNMIPKIEPKEYVLDILDNKLQTCKLHRNNYAVIHLRCGDYFMKIQKNIDEHKHQISKKHVNDIINIINKQFNKNKKYILIGDSNTIKKYITSKFPNILMFNTEITHLGEDKSDNDTAVLDTLIDFNIMRFSNFIISFTAYGHGSGFSKYCSTLYHVPFEQFLLQPCLTYNV